MVKIDIYEWQPIIGCSYTSPGCLNCKAMKLAPEKNKKEFKSHGLIKEGKNGPFWTGDLAYRPEALHEPREVKEPAAFYVCPHGDLFHPSVTQEMLNAIFDVIVECRQHWFQTLTKRAHLQRRYLEDRFGDKPPPNLGVGVSCERQTELDIRGPALLKTPAAARYITLYPLLGPVNIEPYIKDKKVSTVLVGGEEERPYKQEWIDPIYAACVVHNIEFINSSTLIGADA